MVVVARALAVDPADEPDVEVRVAVELLVEARVGVVADVRPPEVLASPRARPRARTSPGGRDRCPAGPARAARSRDRSRQQAGRCVGLENVRHSISEAADGMQASAASRRRACRCRRRAARRRTSRRRARSPAVRASTTSKNVFGIERRADVDAAPREPLELERRRRRRASRTARAASASARGRTRATRGTPPASAPGSRRPSPTRPGAPGRPARPASGWTKTSVPAACRRVEHRRALRRGPMSADEPIDTPDEAVAHAATARTRGAARRSARRARASRRPRSPRAHPARRRRAPRARGSAAARAPRRRSRRDRAREARVEVVLARGRRRSAPSGVVELVAVEERRRRRARGARRRTPPARGAGGRRTSSRRRVPARTNRRGELLERQRHLLGRRRGTGRARGRTRAPSRRRCRASAPSAEVDRLRCDARARPRRRARRGRASPRGGVRRASDSVVRSSTPDSCIVEASSNETGWASSRASAAIACAATPSSESPSCHEPLARDETLGQAAEPRAQELQRSLDRGREHRRERDAQRGRARSRAAASRSSRPRRAAPRRRTTSGFPWCAFSSIASCSSTKPQRVAGGAVHLRHAAERQRILEEARGARLPERAAVEQRVRAASSVSRDARVRPRDRDLGVERADVGAERLEVERGGDVEPVEERARVGDRERGLRRSRTRCSTRSAIASPASSSRSPSAPCARSAFCARSACPTVPSERTTRQRRRR